MSTLYLIRHGQANFGGADYDQLSSLGHEQSRALGRYFAGQGIHFDAVYCGEKRRQQETAQAVLGEMGLTGGFHILPAFNEFDAEGMLRLATPQLLREDPTLAALEKQALHSYADFRILMTRVFRHWVDGTLDAEANPEPWPRFMGRIQAGLETLLREEGDGRSIAVFTSGGPISAALHMLSTEYPAGLNWEISNTSITRLSCQGRLPQAILSAYETPHLPSEQITFI